QTVVGHLLTDALELSRMVQLVRERGGLNPIEDRVQCIVAVPVGQTKQAKAFRLGKPAAWSFGPEHAGGLFGDGPCHQVIAFRRQVHVLVKKLRSGQSGGTVGGKDLLGLNQLHSAIKKGDAGFPDNRVNSAVSAELQGIFVTSLQVRVQSLGVLAREPPAFCLTENQVGKVRVNSSSRVIGGERIGEIALLL